MNSISYVAYSTVLHVSLGRPNRIRAVSDGVVVTTVEGCFPELWPQPFIQRELFSNACFCRTTGRDFSAWKRREPSFLWGIILSFKLSLKLEWLIVDKLHRTNSSLKQFTKRWSRHLDTALDWSVLVDNAIWIWHNNVTNTKVPSTLNQRHGFIAVTAPKCHCCQKILAPCAWYTELCYPIMSSSQTHNFFSPLHFSREVKTRIPWQCNICVQGKRAEDLAAHVLTRGDVFAGYLWHMVQWGMACSQSSLRLSLRLENADAAQRPAPLKENLLLEIFCVVFNDSSNGFATCW